MEGNGPLQIDYRYIGRTDNCVVRESHNKSNSTISFEVNVERFLSPRDKMWIKRPIKLSGILATVLKFAACSGNETATDDHGNDFRPGEGCGVASQIRTTGASIYCSFSKAPLGDFFDTGKGFY